MTRANSTRHAHVEAFCQMQYLCKSCGHREQIWNSRDGVTPFGTACPMCKAPTLYHANFRGDIYDPTGELCLQGQRFWRDGTVDEALSIMQRRFDQARGTPYEPSPDDVERMLSNIRAGTDTSFRPGWPMLDTLPAKAVA
jgi:hypothetical protein